MLRPVIGLSYTCVSRAQTLWAVCRGPPAELDKVPRTIFDDDNANHFYDQIAWFSEPDGTLLLQDMTYTQRAGSFDFIPQIMAGLTRTEISWRISDHYPLWTEFELV